MSQVSVEMASPVCQAPGCPERCPRGLEQTDRCGRAFSKREVGRPVGRRLLLDVLEFQLFVQVELR